MKMYKIQMLPAGRMSYPEGCDDRHQDFRMGLEIRDFDGGQGLMEGKAGISCCTTVLDGEISFSHDGSEAKRIRFPGTDMCGEAESVHLSGKGRLLCLKTARQTRGYIRQADLDGDGIAQISAGEAVGDSVMVFFSETSRLCVQCDAVRIQCDIGEAAVIFCEKKEYKKLHLTARTPEGVVPQVIRINATFLRGNDFAGAVGVRVVHQSCGYCQAELEIRPEHMNPIGTVHGGCLFTLADTTSGIAAASVGGICTTVDGTIQFLNPAFQPKKLIAKASPVKIGRKIRNFEVKITDETGCLISSAQFTFYSLQK